MSPLTDVIDSRRQATAGSLPARRSALASLLALLLLPLLASCPALALSMPAPTGTVLLVIRGAIDMPNVGDEAHFDKALLATLPQHGFETGTPWDEEPQGFEGVLLKDVLAAAGARSSNIDAIGRDDYRASLRDIDIENHPVLLAYRQNGKDLTLRTLGPLRIMFPFDASPEFNSQNHIAAAVWQVVTLEIM